MKNIYLFNPITCELNKTTYKEIQSLTGKSLSSLYSAKCDLSKLRDVGMYIVDDTIKRSTLEALVSKESIEDELWKRILDSNTEVSSYGRYRQVLNKGYKYLVVTSNNNAGTPRVNIKIGSDKCKAYNAHYWVMNLFCDEQEKKPGQVITHKDGKKFNNYHMNLVYSYRNKIVKQAQMKRSMPILKVNPKSMEAVEDYESIAHAARENFISETSMKTAVKLGIVLHGHLWIKDEEMMNSTLYK